MSVTYSSYKPGDIIIYDTDPTSNMTVIPNTNVAEQPAGNRTLLFSDAPEYVKGQGILYQDTISPTKNSGQFRVFAYHVNNVGKILYFSILLTNTSPEPVTVHITKTAVAGPSTSYTAVGKTAVKRWFNSDVSTTVTISAGQTIFLTNPVAAQKNQLVHFIVDAVAKGNVIVSVVARNDRKASLNNLKVLPSGQSSPMRGTFSTSDYFSFYSADLSGNGQYASGVAGDSEYLVGYSAVDDHQMVINYGNYGVLYHTTFQVAPPTVTSAALVLNSRGGTFATESYVSLNGIPQGSLIDVPTNTTSVGTNTLTQGVLLFKNKFSNQTTYTIGIDWMPAGGTNLPVHFIIEPYLPTNEKLRSFCFICPTFLKKVLEWLRF
ncbi:MAG TPA: hypothetical protein VJ824_15355 [Bacillota bacterium]|nr:hypothetical protein [Bacillota bacterium]